jgi:hypothetical protein
LGVLSSKGRFQFGITPKKGTLARILVQIQILVYTKMIAKSKYQTLVFWGGLKLQIKKGR